MQYIYYFLIFEFRKFARQQSLTTPSQFLAFMLNDLIEFLVIKCSEILLTIDKMVPRFIKSVDLF